MAEKFAKGTNPANYNATPETRVDGEPSALEVNQKGSLKVALDNDDGGSLSSAADTARSIATPVIPVQLVGPDGGVNETKELGQAQKVTVVGDLTYVALAPAGTAQATAGWQAYLVTVSGGTTTVTWADGNKNYDNVATDLTALSYS